MFKICDLVEKNNKIYYILKGCNNDELLNILNYKSWELKSFQGKRERKYSMFMYKNDINQKILWSSYGFSPIVVRYLESLGYLINGKEIFRSSKILVGKTYYSLWDYQSVAVNEWFNTGGCGIIKAPTGSGKSIMACSIISKLAVRTIICVHTSDLLINVWFNNLVEQFGEVIKSRIGIIGGLSKKERMKMKIDSSVNFNINIKKDIVIASSQTLVNNLDRLRKENFGLLVYDEIHHSPAEQFKKVINVIKSPYRLGLSATLVRLDGMSPAMYSLIGDIVYSINIKELVMKGKLVDPIFKTIVVNDEKSQNNIRKCGLSGLEYSRYIKNVSGKSVIKKDYIIKLLESLHINNKKFLLYTDFIEMRSGVFTRDYYVKELMSRGIRVFGVSKEMNSNEREYLFNMLKNDELDGLVFGRLGSEGVDIPNVDSVVMANATKSTTLFPQRTGRAMRKGSVKNNKKYAYIYEILLNTEIELGWSKHNFHEYMIENYEKDMIYIDNENKNESIEKVI